MKVAYPRETELFIRIEYVIEFILQHFERLNVYAPVWDKFEKEGLENKVAHEFALFIFLISRMNHKPDSLIKLTDKALNALSEFTRTQANFLEIINNPQKLTRLGQIHIFLTKAGNKNAEWDALIQKMFTKGYGENSERILTRLFDKNWFNHLLFNENIYVVDDIIKYSILNSRCHPIYMSVSEMYAYTHTLMYISNFGKTEIKNNPENSSVKNIINSSLLFQLTEENFDLLGEFLMNYSYVENEWNFISYISWKHFTSTWDELGFLPGVSFDSQVYTQLSNEEKSAYAFKEVYHTNLVAGILCVNILESRYRDDKITIGYPPAFNLKKAEINKSIESGRLFYKINHQIKSERNFDTDILLRQVQDLIECKSVPRWLSIISNLDCDTYEKNTTLVELIMMISVKKQNFELLISSINHYIVMDMEIKQTFVEAVEFICNRQLESGEFLIPDKYIPSILSVLSNVYKKLIDTRQYQYLQ